MPEQEDETGALKAVTDSLQQMAGSLTGRNLEQKIQEYTSVYGEILLGMHNRLNDVERESKSLRKELAQKHRQVSALEQRLSQRRARSQLLPLLSLGALVLSLLSLLWQVWLVWNPTKG